MNSTPLRVTIAVVLLLVGLVAGWFGHRALMSPPDIPTISVYQDWRVACPQVSDKNTSCEIQQDVLDAKSRTELARLSLFRFKDSGDTMVVTVPYNVLLDPGIGLGFGNDKPRVYPFETCNGVGCVVRIKFDADLAKAFDAAASSNSQARILFAGLDGKPVGLPFSLKGYSDAIAAFNRAEAKRRSWWRRLWS
ncbi:MAG TPA: invasion associated locus B family protein [Rhizomicrobium sp.]|nr:invasion associated locus B family protein [Rhizomicrobium sp.]